MLNEQAYKNLRNIIVVYTDFLDEIKSNLAYDLALSHNNLSIPAFQMKYGLIVPTEEAQGIERPYIVKKAMEVAEIRYKGFSLDGNLVAYVIDKNGMMHEYMYIDGIWDHEINYK